MTRCKNCGEPVDNPALKGEFHSLKCAAAYKARQGEGGSMAEAEKATQAIAAGGGVQAVPARVSEVGKDGKVTKPATRQVEK